MELPEDRAPASAQDAGMAEAEQEMSRDETAWKDRVIENEGSTARDFLARERSKLAPLLSRKSRTLARFPAICEGVLCHADGRSRPLDATAVQLERGNSGR
jgi:hypothetical protein